MGLEGPFGLCAVAREEVRSQACGWRWRRGWGAEVKQQHSMSYMQSAFQISNSSPLLKIFDFWLLENGMPKWCSLKLLGHSLSAIGPYHLRPHLLHSFRLLSDSWDHWNCRSLCDLTWEPSLNLCSIYELLWKQSRAPLSEWQLLFPALK